jgi:hypothetical protein
MAILPVGIGSAEEGGYQIERSLRFNSADSAYLNRTPGTASNRKTWTWSGWVKRSKFGDDEVMFSGGVSDPTTVIRFSGEGAASPDGLRVFHYAAGFQFDLTSTAQFRDPSAWYHIIVACDTTQATSSNRLKIYVNGVQVTAFDTATYPSLNYDTSINNTVAQDVGRAGAGSNYLNGYMTEINFIDGQALTPSSFGETNATTGVWSPIAYAGSYGTNGFYLNFSDNSGVTSTTLGKDQAGSNNWTPSGFSVTAGAGNDSLVDTPTPYGTDTGVGGEVRGNYCTWNPLANLGLTLSNGNLTNAYTTTLWTGTSATLAMDSGKWYFEYTVNATGSYTQIGVITVGKPLPTGGFQLQNGTTFAWGYQTLGLVFHAGSDTSSGITSATTNDVISVAVDIDAGKIWIGKNGTFFNSGNPAAGTNAAYTNLSGAMIPVVFSYGTESGDTNFGQRPFAYTAPSGFKALCTQNLPEPTIVDGDDYFNTVLYTGDGAASRSITGVGFQPDWVWVKTRSVVDNHNVFDSVRGVQKRLFSNLTNAEDLTSGTLTSFDSDGFSLGSNPDMNTNGVTLVAWNWKANGAGVSNTDGTITSTVSANTDSGFSIVTYTGTGVNATVGHGLGVAPRMIIIKERNNSGQWWQVGHASADPAWTKVLYLNATDAISSASATFWNNTAPTSTVFSIGTNVQCNRSTGTYVAYCFAAIPGYSAFGSYTGNGSTDGPFVFLGFRPAVLVLKKSSDVDNWFIIDSTRDPYNYTIKRIAPNLSNAENGGEAEATYGIDFNSNGFKVRASHTSTNLSGATYIYAAFAENPFKYSLAR